MPADTLKPRKTGILAPTKQAVEPPAVDELQRGYASLLLLESSLGGLDELVVRLQVDGVFPDIASVTRLVGAVLMEVDDGWQVGKRYISLTSLQRLTDPTPKQVAERVPMRLAPVH